MPALAPRFELAGPLADENPPRILNTEVGHVEQALGRYSIELRAAYRQRPSEALEREIRANHALRMRLREQIGWATAPCPRFAGNEPTLPTQPEAWERANARCEHGARYVDGCLDGCTAPAAQPA